MSAHTCPTCGAIMEWRLKDHWMFVNGRPQGDAAFEWQCPRWCDLNQVNACPRCGSEYGDGECCNIDCPGGVDPSKGPAENTRRLTEEGRMDRMDKMEECAKDYEQDLTEAISLLDQVVSYLAGREGVWAESLRNDIRPWLAAARGEEVKS
jgi:hypothetical protein